MLRFAFFPHPTHPREKHLARKMANSIVFKFLRSFCDCFRKLAPLSQQILTKPMQLCQGLFRALGSWLVCLCVFTSSSWYFPSFWLVVVISMLLAYSIKMIMTHLGTDPHYYTSATGRACLRPWEDLRRVGCGSGTTSARPLADFSPVRLT